MIHNADVHMESEKGIDEITSHFIDVLNSLRSSPGNDIDIKYNTKYNTTTVCIKN